jgi:hypothetical protein
MRLLCTLLVLTLTAAPGWAQGTGATLQGTIRDAQGAVLPGASVVIRNSDTGVARAVTADDGGFYRAAALPPGPYDLQVELSGFVRHARTGLRLTIGQEAVINVTMQLASLEESVTVTAAAPLVETTKSALGATITREQLDSLPLPGRNFTALANLTPGVTGVGGGGLNTAGQLSRNNTFLIDGVSNDEGAVAGTRGGFSIEAVREYAVMANQFPAEFGRASGAMVTIVTRSGTNRIDGRVFALHRDDSLDAQDPFSKAQGSGKAPFSEQRFGGLLGGPLRRDRTHYFGSYEGRRLRETNVITSVLVPVNEREHPQTTDGHQAFAKVDHVFNAANTLNVRYRIDNTEQTGVGIGGLNTRERGRDFTNTSQDIVSNFTTILSNRAVNEFRFQFARLYRWNDVSAYTSRTGYTINRPSGNFGKANNQEQGESQNYWQFIENLSYTRGSHTLKAGVDIQVVRMNVYFLGNKDGTFTFATDRPFDPNDRTTYPTQFTQNVGDPNDYEPNELYAGFIQDTWRVGSRLTLNLGLRYETETAFARARDVGVKDDRDNLAPRLGFAWDPFGDAKTAIRGGYGLYYDQAFLNITGNVTVAANSIGVTIINPGYPDPYAGGTVRPQQRSLTLASPDIETPNTHTFSIGAKRELWAGLAVSADFVRTRGYNLFNQFDINYPDPITRVRPNPEFLRMNQYETTGNSWYRGLLVSVERRGGRGPGFGVSYTLSRSIRDVEDFGFQAQDQNNRAAEKGYAGNNRKHQLVANMTYALPWGFQIGALLQARTGLPWNITTGVDSNGDTIVNDRPDLADPNGDPNLSSTYNAAFTGRVGNLPRNYGTGPNFVQVDARVSKFVRLGVRRVEAFVEAFNLANRPNFGLPNGNLRSAQFGRSTGTAGSPRQVEFGLRFDF